MILNIDTSKKYQTMKGFGASGAWWAQIVGKWESVDAESGKKTKDRISELLFSKEKGIGINIFRYNLGSGSSRSGKGNYSDPARRADSFEDGDSYDFTRDKAAVYMMKKAVDDGAEDVIFFVNSPLEKLTENGMGHLGKRAFFRTNLSRKNVPAFCKYCLDVTEHFIKEGIPVKYISPVNEPLWLWNGGQEGCHYSPLQTRYVLKTFAREIKKRGLSTLRLSGAENGDIRWFNKSYTRAVLDCKEIRELTDGIDIHSYCLPQSFLPKFLNDRMGFLKRYRKYMDRRYPGVDITVSEWTHMCGGKDCTMKSALEQAKVMYEDISVLNACSWQHWIACSMYDYCDGLIYVDNSNESFEMTKRYYAFGNFSKFIPKGSIRVKADCDDDDVNVLAFVKDGKKTVIIINPSETEKKFTVTANAKFYVTDSDDDLKEYTYSAGEEIKITARSVNTLIYGEET